ncbi:MAG TPA: ATP-binding protein, partial [Bacteroidota bacterium]|nr:ATP-binding protein [Bacteroidota bacterium]
YEFSEQLTSKLDVDQIYSVVAEHASRLLPFNKLVITLYDPETEAISLAYQVQKREDPSPVPRAPVQLTQHDSDDPYWKVIRSKRSYQDPSFPVLYVPMISKETIMGVITSIADPETKYSDTHLRLLESIGNLAGIAIEKAKLHEETIAKSAEIERRNKELDDFTYVVSHDLKEPLISVEGFSNILRLDYREIIQGEGKEYLDSIEGASVRMKALIDDLLVLSRISRPSESFKSVSTEKVINDVKTEMEYTLRQKDVRFIVPENLPSVFGNETQIKIVFRNLIGNSLKFNDKPQQIVEIGFEEADSSRYKFFVRDNGIGIDSEFFEKIFIIFQRLHRREQYEGTGAGLAIVKKIVELHKGTVWVESVPDKGSTFYFTLPKVLSLNS